MGLFGSVALPRAMLCHEAEALPLLPSAHPCRAGWLRPLQPTSARWLRRPTWAWCRPTSQWHSLTVARSSSWLVRLQGGWGRGAGPGLHEQRGSGSDATETALMLAQGGDAFFFLQYRLCCAPHLQGTWRAASAAMSARWPCGRATPTPSTTWAWPSPRRGTLTEPSSCELMLWAQPAGTEC